MAQCICCHLDDIHQSTVARLGVAAQRLDREFAAASRVRVQFADNVADVLQNPRYVILGAFALGQKGLQALRGVERVHVYWQGCPCPGAASPR